MKLITILLAIPELMHAPSPCFVLYRDSIHHSPMHPVSESCFSFGLRLLIARRNATYLYLIFEPPYPLQRIYYGHQLRHAEDRFSTYALGLWLGHCLPSPEASKPQNLYTST